MSLTRANTEFLVIPRVGPLMAAAGMDSTTVDGTNADLNGPIGRAVRDLGYSVASAVLVADADVAQVTDANTDQYLDLATLHTLEAVLGNLDDVTIRVGPLSETLSDLAKQAERKVERLSVSLERKYGYGLSSVTTGYLQKDFAEHD